MPSLSLKIRITALALLVAILPLAISQLIYADRTTKTLLEYFGNNIGNRSIQLSNTLDTLITQHVTNILTISKSHDLRHSDIEPVDDYLKNVMARNNSISEVALIDKDGLVKVSTDKNEQKMLMWEIYLGVRELFTSSINASENQVFVSEANHLSGVPEIMMLTPVFKHNTKKAVGVLLVKYSLKDIEQFLYISDEADSTSLKTYVVDKLGNIILKSDPGISYAEKFNDVKHQTAMLSNNMNGTLEYRTENGIDVIAGFSDMREYGKNKALDWTVISVAPVEEVIYPAIETRNVLFKIGLILTALVTLVAYFFARGISLPIQRTAMMAEEIRRGDYSHRLDASLGGEIGSLATAINEMADRIDERTAEIVNRNEKLTSEITERKLAEDRLKVLSHKTIRLQEEERQRVSRELHDGINQLLVSVKYKLENFVDLHSKEGGDEFKDITNAVLFLDDAIHEVRRISHDLRPTVLDDLGLAAAIRNIARQFYERNQIDVEINGMDDEVMKRFPTDVETALYRIVQEALMNIEKHANATKVVINMTHTDINVTIRIEDDGEGFDLQSALRKTTSNQGIGLRNMRERIELLQGSFFMHSEEGKGTFVEVEAPLYLE